MFAEDNLADVADSKRNVISGEDKITDVGLGDDITVNVSWTEEEG